MDDYFLENKPIEGLGRASVRSGMILIAAKGISVVSQVASLIVLGRLLGPHDFGLTATIFALIGFGPVLVDLGTSEATSQKTHITRDEVSALFWTNTAIGGALTVIFAASAGLIANFYNEPTLQGIAIAASLTFIASGVSTQHAALMRRAMRFRNLALVDIFANIVSTVISITMAFTGWGYWALVAKPVSLSLLTVVGLWLACPWVPGRPSYTAEANTSIRFGLGVTGFTMTDWFAQSIDRLALSFFYGFGALGYYQNAYLFYTNLLNLLASPLHNIAVSSLSKLRNDMDEFKTSWARALSAMSFFAAAAFALLAVTGSDIIVILLSDKWAPAGPVLCLFAIRGIAQIVERTLGWLHVPLGRSDRWMQWGFASAICQVVAVIAGLPFGPIGVAAAGTVALFILFVPALLYAGHPVGISAKDIVSAVGPQMVAGLAAVAVGLLSRHLFLSDYPALARFIISSLICVSTYLAVVVGIFRLTAPLQLALSAVYDVIPKRLLGNR